MSKEEKILEDTLADVRHVLSRMGGLKLRLTLSIDPGIRDQTDFVLSVTATGYADPDASRTFALTSWVRTRQLIADLAHDVTACRIMLAQFGELDVVMDFGGGGSAIAEELKRCHGVTVRPKDKTAALKRDIRVHRTPDGHGIGATDEVIDRLTQLLNHADELLAMVRK